MSAWMLNFKSSTSSTNASRPEIHSAAHSKTKLHPPRWLKDRLKHSSCHQHQKSRILSERCCSICASLESLCSGLVNTRNRCSKLTCASPTLHTSRIETNFCGRPVHGSYLPQHCDKATFETHPVNLAATFLSVTELYRRIHNTPSTGGAIECHTGHFRATIIRILT